MVPAAFTDDTLDAGRRRCVEPGDVLIDGGNSYYRDDIAPRRELEAQWHPLRRRRHQRRRLRARARLLPDDRRRRRAVVKRCSTRSSARSPPVSARSQRTPGARASPRSAEHGYLHCGPAGAGHFVKMVHNGIEYGRDGRLRRGAERPAQGRRRQGPARGRRRDRRRSATPSATTTTTSTCPTIAEVWRRGSVIASWLLDLTATALVEEPELDDFSGRVSDSGEGRWTVAAAVDEGVPANVLSAALYSALRLARRGRLRRQAPLGDAQAVRRARRKAGRRGVTLSALRPSAGVGERYRRLGRRSRRVARDGRPARDGPWSCRGSAGSRCPGRLGSCPPRRGSR